MTPLRRIGLTGGIGSGKSEVGRTFAACGALVIDADVLAREALAPGSAGLARVAARWPATVRDGSLDRAALASVIFADATAREAVNGIVHPYVRARGAEIEATAAPGRLVVHDVPLLFETGLETRFDASVLVVAPRAQRIARVLARSGLAPAETERRMAAQIDPETARGRATFTIENAGSLEELERAARAVYATLARGASATD